jgi:hypothetical protein
MVMPKILSLDNLGQLANMLWLIWIVAASVALARRDRTAAAALAVPVQT